VTTRVVFLGTPEFAVPSLDALARLRDAGVIDLAGVVTQPDRPGDRGRVTAPPIKERAVMLGLPVWQPPRLTREVAAKLAAERPDALVWAAYGNLIPRALIDAVQGRAANVHASLLPRWRGAAPVHRAILAGDRETGVTLMKGTADLDAGPILAQERTPIGPNETAGQLTARLAQLGAALLERELPRYLSGELRGRPQDSAHVTHAAKITTADAKLDFARPADELARQVRGTAPQPGAFTTVRGRRIVVTKASVAGGSPAQHGALRVRDGVPHVASGAGWLRLDEVRPAGKGTMSGADWARGLRDIDDSRVPS
jgi:methionyl-tRNA formyltransferase